VKTTVVTKKRSRRSEYLQVGEQSRRGSDGFAGKECSAERRVQVLSKGHCSPGRDVPCSDQCFPCLALLRL